MKQQSLLLRTVVLFLLSLGVVFLLVACGGSRQPKQDSKKSGETHQEQPSLPKDEKEQARKSFLQDNDKASVVVINFTGEKCYACPQMAKKVRQAEESMAPNYILVAMHCFFSFSPNYYNEEADIFAFKRYSIGAIPALRINNIYEGLKVNVSDEKINEELSKPDRYKTYINVERKERTVEVKYLADIRPQFKEEEKNRKLKVLFWITEDKLISPQKDKNGVIEKYEHKNIFRGALSSTPLQDLYYGKRYTPGVLYKGSFRLPETVSDPANCRIIALLTDIEDSNRFVDALRVSIP